MSVSPLPQHGDVFVGRDTVGRTLRVSAHPDRGRVVLSIWQDAVCRATVRIVAEDVPDLLATLSTAAHHAEGPVDGVDLTAG